MTSENRRRSWMRDRAKVQARFALAAALACAARSASAHTEDQLVALLPPTQCGPVVVIPRTWKPQHPPPIVWRTCAHRVAANAALSEAAPSEVAVLPVDVPATTPGEKPNDFPAPQQVALGETPSPFERLIQSKDVHSGVPSPHGPPVASFVTSPFDTRTGVFSALRAANGWSSVRVVVDIPCATSHFVQDPATNADEEVGYIYIGGWGAGPNTSAVAVDAGLQLSSHQAAHEAYSAYFLYDSNEPITFPERFPCGTEPVTLEMYPLTSHLLMFVASGRTQSGRTAITFLQRTADADGWWPNGGTAKDGIILKRVVSIAQRKDLTSASSPINRLRDGSYFGVSSISATGPGIRFLTCQIGRVDPSTRAPGYITWTRDSAATWHPKTGNTFQDFPTSAVSHIGDGGCDHVFIRLAR